MKIKLEKIDKNNLDYTQIENIGLHTEYEEMRLIKAKNLKESGKGIMYCMLAVMFFYIAIMFFIFSLYILRVMESFI